MRASADVLTRVFGLEGRRAGRGGRGLGLTEGNGDAVE